ncbi:MAG: hypothetical protein M0R32_07405 [Candidatus Cloacimonetes bacterium]|nr:hypothetical protein [Candidatus Cloacimonadota bacterium]
MKSLEGFDVNLQADLKSRISYLPSAEKILAMGSKDLEELRGRLDRLLYDMDRADNKRSVGYSLRHRVDKRLPPPLPPVVASGWYDKYKQGGKNESNPEIRPDRS